MGNDLAIKNKELAMFYSSSTDKGLEDAGNTQAFPLVKLTNNLSKENILADGKPSQPGKLYHSELKQDFDSIDCNICYVGQFELPDFNNPNEKKMTYIVGAIKKDDNTPFLIYVKGYSLQNMWDFLNDISSIKARHGLPMFALSAKIMTTKRSHPKFKEVDVLKLVVYRDKVGNPEFEQDLARAQSLDKTVDEFKDVVKRMIKKGDGQDDPYLAGANNTKDEFLDSLDPKDDIPL